jgi:hypothetical protein
MAAISHGGLFHLNERQIRTHGNICGVIGDVCSLTQVGENEMA